MLGPTKKIKLWDSWLEYTLNIDQEVNEVIAEIGNKFKYNPEFENVSVSEDIIEQLPKSDAYYWYGEWKIDYTCVAKGFFLKCVERKIIESGKVTEDYYINFGGDCLVNAVNNMMRVKSKYYPFAVLSRGRLGVFTSTNFERPGHIPDAKYETAIVSSQSDQLDWMDIAATRTLCNDYFDSSIIKFKDGKIIGKTYIASPFFNDTDIAIRDAMLRLFSNCIRPDLLNPNIEGNLHKDRNLAARIKSDNLQALDACEILVFPKDTTDLGTLFEVGYAIRNQKKIIRFDYTTGLYEWMINPQLPELPNDYVTLDLNRLGSGVMLGYHFEKRLSCYLGDSTDNIMLMDNPHVIRPQSLYPCYLPDLLSESTFHLNTITSGS